MTDNDMSEEKTTTPEHTIVMYESNLCGFCMAARRLIDKKGWQYQSLNVDGNMELRAEMQTRTGRTSVPQIYIGETHVGGFDDLAELEQDGELDALYNEAVNNN